MNLIMKDFEEHFLAHHPGHVHLEPGATAHSGSSIRRLTSASRHFSLRQPCLPTSVPPVCSYWTMLQFTRTHLPREVAGTFFWQPRAWDPSARRATGLVGACAGCWWVGRREMRRFQLHPGRGAKNAKKGESESKKARERERGRESEGERARARERERERERVYQFICTASDWFGAPTLPSGLPVEKALIG